MRTRPNSRSSEATLLTDCRVSPTRDAISWNERPGTSDTAARTAARPAAARAAKRGTSPGSISPEGKTLTPSDWRYRFSMRSHVCQRTVAGDIFRSRLMSPIRAHGRRQRYRNTCRRRAFARLRPSPSKSTSIPSRDTARCRARPSPRATSRPLILLDNQVEDLLRLQRAKVVVRESVQGFLERVAHGLRQRMGEQELTELGRCLRRDGLSAIDAFDHNPEAADDLECVRRRTVSAVATLDDVQEPRRIRVVAVELQVDDTVREVHRDHGLGTGEVPWAVFLERAQDRSHLSRLLEHVADQVPLFVQVLRRPEDRRERVDDDSSVAAFPVRDERRKFLADEIGKFSARCVDEDEELVVEIVEDVGPAHLDRLADDLLLVLVERDEDAFLAVLQAAADELRGQGGLARAGATDHDGRAVLVDAAVQKRVESVDSTPNLTHAISSRREPDKRADLRIRHEIECSREFRLESANELVDHLLVDPVPEDSVHSVDDLPVAEQREGRDDVDRVVLPEWVVLVVQVHGRESPRSPGGELLEFLFEPPTERTPRGPEHDDGRLVGFHDRLLECVGIPDLQHRRCVHDIRER